MDLFESKNISPMLLNSASSPFDDKNYIFELKLDGIRCIAYLDKDKTILRNKRNKDVTEIYPELKNIHKFVKHRCILDGELVALNNDGTPNFFALQKRSLMTDKFKIELESEKNKVNFVAYDILYLKNKDLTTLPLIERKKLLEENIVDNEFISKSRYIFEKGIEFFNLTKKLGLEGIVAKKVDGKYVIGKRTSEWIKIKNLIDEDLIICGVLLDENNQIKDLILGESKNKKLTYRGKVFLNISKEEQKSILNFAKKSKVATPHFENLNPNIIWIKPSLICTIQYMMKTRDGNMRQPVFKGLRLD